MTWINYGDQYFKEVIPSKLEEIYNAKYIADLCLRTKTGGWSEQPAMIFWQEKPPNPEFSNYFGIYPHPITNEWYITSAQSAAEGYWDAMVADDGEIIFSRYRHDYRVSADKSVMVDGGRDYFKSYGKKSVLLQLVKEQMTVVENIDE